MLAHTGHFVSTMRILVSNDDGYLAPGITALAAAMRPLGDVTVVAPEADRSGMVAYTSHMIGTQKMQAYDFNVSGPYSLLGREHEMMFGYGEAENRSTSPHAFNAAQAADYSKIRELIARAAQFGVAVEVNSHYHPNALKMLKWCQEHVLWDLLWECQDYQCLAWWKII